MLSDRHLHDEGMQHRAWRDLLRDEGSGITAVATLGAGARGVYRSDRGSVSLLVLFMGLVVFALAALNWNTGLVTVAKVEAQTAADTAAYTSALWTSRAVNIIAATNPILLRDSSAVPLGFVLFGLGLGVLIALIIFAIVFAIQGAIQAAILNFPGAAILFARAARAIAEIVIWTTSFLDPTGFPNTLTDSIDLIQHMSQVSDFQSQWIREIPGALRDQRDALEDYYDCDIDLWMGRGAVPSGFSGRGSGLDQVGAPLERGNPINSLIPATMRFVYDAFGSDSWDDELGEPPLSLIRTIPITPRNIYRIAAIPAGIGANIGLATTHHNLSSASRSFLPEVGPDGDGIFSTPPLSRGDYTIIAVARKRGENVNSQQTPREPLGLMAPGLFGARPDQMPVAFAQAEAFHPIDGLLPSLGLPQPLLILGTLYPWRTWTDWGWQWQPRLTRTDLMPPAALTQLGIVPPSSSQAVLH